MNESRQLNVNTNDSSSRRARQQGTTHERTKARITFAVCHPTKVEKVMKTNLFDRNNDRDNRKKQIQSARNPMALASRSDTIDGVRVALAVPVLKLG